MTRRGYKGMKFGRLIIGLIAFTMIYIIFGCYKDDSKRLAIEPQESNIRKNIVSNKTEGDTILSSDINKFFLIETKLLDFNLDGRKEEVYFVGTPPEGGLHSNISLFYNPCYFIYKNRSNQIYERIEVEFQSYACGVDLFKDMFKTRYVDIDGDKIPEVLYSYDFPMPEQIGRTPHIIKYNVKTGEFEDIKIEGYVIANWDVEDVNKDGISELWIDLDQYTSVEKPYRRYLKLVDGKLIEAENR